MFKYLTLCSVICIYVKYFRALQIEYCTIRQRGARKEQGLGLIFRFFLKFLLFFPRYNFILCIHTVTTVPFCSWHLSRYCQMFEAMRRHAKHVSHDIYTRESLSYSTPFHTYNLKISFINADWTQCLERNRFLVHEFWICE